MVPQQIERLSDDTKKLTPRTRFLLKDLIELRKNNYVPRRAQETAKTISQVGTSTHKLPQLALWACADVLVAWWSDV